MTKLSKSQMETRLTHFMGQFMGTIKRANPDESRVAVTWPKTSGDQHSAQSLVHVSGEHVAKITISRRSTLCVDVPIRHAPEHWIIIYGLGVARLTVMNYNPFAED